MSTLNLNALQAYNKVIKTNRTKPRVWNQKQAINQYIRQFKHSFDMDDSVIDLRAMSENFDHNIIPLSEIHNAILTVLGPNFQTNPTPFNPGEGYLGYEEGKQPKEYFDYLPWEESLALWTIFQRDVAPYHVRKIYNDFDPTSVIVPCIIRITLENGKVVYCVWDGHHTIQVCRLRGWTHFPAWIINLDKYTLEEIENAGFGDTIEERVKFGCWIAGKNMRRINGLMKRDLSPYDDFLIGYETRDAKIVAMMNILLSNDCKVKRHPVGPGAWTQIKAGYECFDLESSQGDKDGRFWARAIGFHRKVWTGAPLTLEVYRPLSYLYQRANIQGITLPPSFDDELAQMFIKRFGDPESVQTLLKVSFWNALNANNGSMTGTIPTHDKERVLAGIINFYKQNGGKAILPPPSCQWNVEQYLPKDE